MRLVMIAIVFPLSLPAIAQKTETFYDYTWKPCSAEAARFYSIVEKTDSGWLRRDYFLGNKKIQSQALYEDEKCRSMNGRCYYFFANGQAETIGQRIHNKQEGNYVRYHSNGMIADSAFYEKGKAAGSRMRWYRNGSMSDSIYHANDSMDVHLSWFEDGSLASAGYLLRGDNHGKWKYYHHNGQLSAEEVYNKGKLVSANYFDADGSAITDTSDVNRPAMFKAGIEEWRNYLSKKLYWPQGYNFTSGNMAVVVVQFTVNENGKIEDEEVVIPFHPEFDKIALRVIRDSPQWRPAVAHNRKVSFVYRQPVTFSQPEN